ncbi:TetR family transcriptional regulator [Pseudonocardia hierapolitana]|uniref:TetR family transcriptional regulator n=1 Tax=Pseudonocardia hierapolitana TaxID=1128676 RepID=A0A561SRT5_9PSEU|nr:TetR family transcriptional regulator [Pseudonocardia hierapolitana]TWF77580.1 TetR family transcriptional regulator [Pseudonocardia hierapolitana]
MTTTRGSTRDAIVSAALELFRERGFDGTTMRAVAERAGVSVGNAYYYFSSKDELVQGFYDQLVAEHRALALPELARHTDLAERLGAALHCWVTVAEPYREFAGRFFAVAAQPGNPLSPFSAEAGPARAAAVDLYREVLAGARVDPDPELARELPELLWLQHLGIVLFWVHDRSDGAARTRLLVDRTVPMVARLVRLSRMPVLRPLGRQVVDLVRLLRDRH